jgi:LysM repeat protein
VLHRCGGKRYNSLMSFRQMLPFLMLNIVVSAVVILSILFWWDRRDNPSSDVIPEPTAALALGLPTPVIADPSSGAEPEEAAAEAAQPVVHVVQSGDTLGIISQRYDVTIDDIMLVNGLTNPNLISVGEQLTIPVGGIPTPTPAAPEEPEVAALPSPIPTEPAASAGGGQIEVAGVLDAGLLETEAVQIVNTGAAEQQMEGWKIRDEDSNVYTFSRMSIFGEGAGVLIHTRSGTDTATDLFWGQSQPLWRSGETLTLWDAAGEVVATFIIP